MDDETASSIEYLLDGEPPQTISETARVVQALRAARELLERVWPIVDHEFNDLIPETGELERMVVKLGGKLEMGRPPARRKEHG